MRYDGETGLYWMSVRAYDPSLGRFLSRDPLNRVPLFFSDQPYVYAGNNPLVNVDPSGQSFYVQGMSGAQQAKTNRMMIKAARAYRVNSYTGGSNRCNPNNPKSSTCTRWVNHAKKLRSDALDHLQAVAYGSMLGGGVILALSAALDFWAENRTIHKLELFLGLASAFAGYILPGLGGLLQYAHVAGASQLLSVAQFLSAGINTVLEVVTGAIGLYKAWGWLAQNAVDLAVFAVQGAVSGIPGALSKIALQLLGTGIAAIGVAAANALFAQMNASFAEYNRESNTDPKTWCSLYSHGACGPVPMY